MNIVKRAIIMAAGKGERMYPVTEDIPKPLVKVNGVRMIDTVIDALNKNNINEIYIVVGYMKEKFEILKEKYSNIIFIENPFYDTCNNISSLYVAREHLGNSIILDADQVIYNHKILSPYFEYSGYNAIWSEEETKEWLMQLDNGFVVSCNRNGGKKGWGLFSVSRWTEDDGKKLKYFLEEDFEKNKNTQIYWDDVVMFNHFEDFKLGIYPMTKEDIIEIDTFDELVKIDSTYLSYNK